MSLTSESPLTGLWPPTTWRSTFVWLCQWFNDFAPLGALGEVGRNSKTGDSAVHLPDQLVPPNKIDPSGSLDGAVATHPPRGDTAEDICAAVELKFLLPVPPIIAAGDHNSQQTESQADPQAWAATNEASLARRAYELIAQTIQKYAGQRSVTLHDIVASGHQERDFWPTHWIVKRANSAKLLDEDNDKTHAGHHWVPVEVCSPKLQWKGTNPGTGPAIDAVLKALTARHRGIVANHTCDVHVHVGRADGRHFALPTLKRLATLLWLAEDVLRSVRDPASPNFHNVYTWGAEVRKHSRLAAVLERQDADRGPAPPLDSAGGGGDLATAAAAAAAVDPAEYRAISMIWEAGSHLELGRLLSGSTRQYRRLGFNFSSLGEEDERARKGPKTVEFRVLEGTLRDEVVLPWTRICCTLVEIAIGDPQDRFRDVVGCLLGKAGGEGGAAGMQHRFGDFMHCLGIAPGVADAFLESVHRDRAG